MPRWRYTVTDPVPTHYCALQIYNHFSKSKPFMRFFHQMYCILGYLLNKHPTLEHKKPPIAC